MKPNTWFLHPLLLLFVSLIPGIHGGLNLIIKSFENCDPTVDYPNKFYGTVRTVYGKQYADGNATLKAAIDDDLKSNFTIELLVGTNYMQVIRFEERHTCKSIHKYIGEFAYDFERAAQLVPGLCPIPPGRYHIHNHPLNFNMVSLQNIPFGQLRMKEIGTDKNNKVLGCIVAEAENKIL